ncbi:MAG: hypothetical protein R2705_01670 [Ilumatobacteraceae bacterium]
MSVESTTSTAPSSRDVSPPWWRDVTVLAWVFQFAVLAIVLAIVAWLVNNVRVNSSEQNIPTGFAFLDQPAGFEIPGNSFRQSQSVSAAIYQGFLNTPSCRPRRHRAGDHPRRRRRGRAAHHELGGAHDLQGIRGGAAQHSAARHRVVRLPGCRAGDAEDAGLVEASARSSWPTSVASAFRG